MRGNVVTNVIELVTGADFEPPEGTTLKKVAAKDILEPGSTWDGTKYVTTAAAVDPADAIKARLVVLRDKADKKTITSAERVEAVDLILLVI